MLTFYMRVPSNKVVGLVVRKVLLSPLYCNKICKIILTCPAIHDTLYHKSHQICRKVQNGEDLFPMKIFTAPQHTRSILPLTSSDKIIPALRGRYFSFSQIKSYVVVQSSKICFWLLTTQPQSVILVLERSRT